MDRREVLNYFAATGATVLGGTALADHGAAPASGEKPTAVSGPHAHFCGIHVSKQNPKIQLVVQHYCVAHTGGHGDDALFQCILFDGTGPNSKLVGVEYIISDAAYRALPDGEKKYWHPHTYEVLAGGLIAPGMPEADERQFMKAILTTWGKTWHTWPDPKTPVPLGEPMLIWALTGDGQADPAVVAARDKQFHVNTDAVRKRRGEELKLAVPQVPAPASMDTVGRQWTAAGNDVPTDKK